MSAQQAIDWLLYLALLACVVVGSAALAMVLIWVMILTGVGP